MNTRKYAFGLTVVAVLFGCDTNPNTDDRAAIVSVADILGDFVDDKGQLDDEANMAFISAVGEANLGDFAADPNTWELIDNNLGLSNGQTTTTAREKCEGINGHFQEQEVRDGKEGSWHGWYKCGKLIRQMFCTGGGIAGCKDV